MWLRPDPMRTRGPRRSRAVGIPAESVARSEAPRDGFAGGRLGAARHFHSAERTQRASWLAQPHRVLTCDVPLPFALVRMGILRAQRGDKNRTRPVTRVRVLFVARRAVRLIRRMIGQTDRVRTEQPGDDVVAFTEECPPMEDSTQSATGRRLAHRRWQVAAALVVGAGVVMTVWAPPAQAPGSGHSPPGVATDVLDPSSGEVSCAVRAAVGGSASSRFTVVVDAATGRILCTAG